MIMGSSATPRAAEARGVVAVVATLSKGYDLDYIWKQVDRGPAKDAASYYIQASESGGEPPGRWWGPGARALGFEPGQRVERKPYDLLFGERKAPDGTRLGRPPGDGRKAADLYARLLAAEPHATAERRRELRIEAIKQARQSPLFFDLTISLSKSISIFHASLGENARLARQAGDRDGDRVLVRPGHRGRRHDLAGRARRVRLLPARGRLHPHRLAQHPGARPGDRPVARGGPGRGALAAAHLPRRRHAAARPLPDRPRRQDAPPTANGGLRTPWATTSTSARSPRSSPSTWKKRSPRRFGVEWVARDDGHGFEIKGISGEMMRVFSSRRESITADLRARAARFEQRYGRAPSQRELAQLAQASNFKTRAAKEGALDFTQLHAGWADKLARTLGVLAGVGRAVGLARRRRPRRRARARPGLTGSGSCRARAGPRGAEGGRAGPAGEEHVDPRGCDQVPGPGPAPVRHRSGCGRRAAGGPGRPGAAVGVRAGRLPGGTRAGREFRAACCARTGAASTSGTAASGTPRARSWSWKSACSRKPARTARRA